MSALSLQADIFLGFVVPETAGTFAQTLGPVQGLGRFFQQLGKGTFLVAAQDGAGGAAAEKLHTRQELADGAADLGTLAPDRLGVVHAAEDHHELVPAVAAEDVAVSGAPAQQLAEGFQQLAVMVVAAAALVIVLLAVWFWLHRDDCSDRALVLAAALLAVAIPFFLPHMHDRYFFAADALTLALAAAWPQLVLPAVLCEFASLLGYHAYLRMRYLLPMADGALALIAALVILTVVLALELRQRSPLNGKIKKST